MDVLVHFHPVLRRLNRRAHGHHDDDNDDDDDQDSCQMPRLHEKPADLSIGITVQALFTYIALACLALTMANAIFLISRHLHRYTVPKEQKHCVRIIALPMIFCIIATICIHFDTKAIYIEPILDVYEALCVAGLFILFVEFIAPDESSRDAFFDKQPLKDKKGNVIGDSSLHWYRVGLPSDRISDLE
jgi:hypothetical protein